MLKKQVAQHIVYTCMEMSFCNNVHTIHNEITRTSSRAGQSLRKWRAETSGVQGSLSYVIGSRPAWAITLSSEQQQQQEKQVGRYVHSLNKEGRWRKLEVSCVLSSFPAVAGAILRFSFAFTVFENVYVTLCVGLAARLSVTITLIS